MNNSIILLVSILLSMVSYNDDHTIANDEPIKIELSIVKTEKGIKFQSSEFTFKVINNTDEVIFFPTPNISPTEQDLMEPEYFKAVDNLSNCSCDIYEERLEFKTFNQYDKIEPNSFNEYTRLYYQYNYNCWCESCEDEQIEVELSYMPNPNDYTAETLSERFSKEESKKIQDIIDFIPMDTIISNKVIIKI